MAFRISSLTDNGSVATAHLASLRARQSSRSSSTGASMQELIASALDSGTSGRVGISAPSGSVSTLLSGLTSATDETTSASTASSTANSTTDSTSTSTSTSTSASTSATTTASTSATSTAAATSTSASSCPTVESVFGDDVWATDPTGTAPDGTVYGYNSWYFATESTAAKVAELLGGTVVETNAMTGSSEQFQQSQSNYMVKLSSGTLVNPGLVASFYTHGYSQTQVDSMLANEVKLS
jgi:trimeric autotransporter adhesin